MYHQAHMNGKLGSMSHISICSNLLPSYTELILFEVIFSVTLIITLPQNYEGYKVVSAYVAFIVSLLILYLLSIVDDALSEKLTWYYWFAPYSFYSLFPEGSELVLLIFSY